MYDLSILIPARNELFLAQTIANILENIEGDTEIIAVMDGYWPTIGVPVNDRVSVIHVPESVGQRAATNLAARISGAKYVAKCDAHCAFDKGFDIKLLSRIQDDWTIVPTMKNLHAFDWVCKNGHRRYQGPSGECKECGEPTTMDIIWQGKRSPNSNSYCFDSEPHFQYFGEYSKRPEGHGELTESMSLQGSFFMMTRKRYLELNICDEEFGSWGSQGIEVALKSWLSGGRVIVDHSTWYAHMFRTQGGDFGFPYHLSNHQVEHAKKTVRDVFWNCKWEHQQYPVSWLIEKFYPVKGWSDEDLAKLKEIEDGNPIKKKNTVPAYVPDSSVPSGCPPATVSRKTGHTLTKGAIYYTDNRLDSEILLSCQNQLKKCFDYTKLTKVFSVSLAPVSLGKNIILPLGRSVLTMFKQILAGLEACDADIVYFCEHDILYHPSHFEFTPEKKDAYYYNTNVWKVRYEDGHALWCDDVKQTSGLCGYRDLLVEHYRKRIQLVLQNAEDLRSRGEPVKRDGYPMHMGFEPGTHSPPRGVDSYPALSYLSAMSNIDIRHSTNLTPNRWSKDLFRNQRYTRGWKEQDYVEGWYTKGEFRNLIKSLL